MDKVKHKRQQDIASDFATESITCWSLPKSIKNRLYRNKIADVYSLTACSKKELSTMGFNDFEVCLIECTLQNYDMGLKETE